MLDILAGGAIGYFIVQAFLVFCDWNESRKHLNAKLMKRSVLQSRQPSQMPR